MDLTIALDRYDRHFPFFDGTVKPPAGVNLKVLQVGQSSPARDGRDRHERMLKGEFDIAEFSMSSYLMAVERHLPVVAIPVFPRRLFSPGLIYVHADSPLTTPAALAGKRIVIRSFQTTLSLLAKGDLKFEYGVPWEDIHWLVERNEEIEFEPKPGVTIELLPRGSDIGLLLSERKVDCVLQPHPPRSITSGRLPVRRLLADPDAEELRLFRKYGYCPIMHVLVMKAELAMREPALPAAIMEMYDQAARMVDDYFSDPNWSSLIFGRRYYEREKDMLGQSAWPSGLKANRDNLGRFLLYSRDQGLIGDRLTVDELFPAAVRDT
jgi:4,5-dihydroxyphthalate decarboxylase